MKRLLLILNPIAGKKRANRELASIIEIFNRGGYQVCVHVTAGNGDARNIVAERCCAFDVIVCVGGDGTFNEVISGHRLAGSRRPLGYLPAGSTNDFASSLRLSKDLKQAARDLMEGQATPLDLGRFNDRYFSYIASFGAFTRASYTTAQSLKNALGHFAYLLAGIKEVAAIRSIPMVFRTADGRVFEDEYIFGAIGNTTSLAGVLTLDPDLVDMSDGKFELILIRKPRTPIELSDCVLALTTQEYDTPMLTFISTTRVEIDCEEEIPWTLDGEAALGSTHCVVENLHHAINIILNHKRSLPTAQKRKELWP